MHICFVSREYPPNTMGGIGTYVVNMAQLLADAGHTVSVLTRSHPNVAARGIDSPVLSHGGRLRAYYIPFADDAWRLDPGIVSPEAIGLSRKDITMVFAWSVAEALSTLLNREQVDAIEAPEYEAPLSLFQSRRRCLPPDHPFRAVPCIVHLHSPSRSIFCHNDEDLSGDWQQFRFRQEQLSIQWADAVLCPSRFLADEVRDWCRLDNDRITVIPYPLGPPLALPRTSSLPDPHRFLYVGRIEPRKGVFEFVEAAVALAARQPCLSFRFVGAPTRRSSDDPSAGDTRDLLKIMIPRPLLSQFSFMDRIPRDELGAEYAASRFCVVPSRWDNLPNTCIEAMMCGKPVVCSDRGGMAELVEDGVSGFIGRPGEHGGSLPAALRATLERALAVDDERVRRMGESARDRVNSFCRNEAIVARHETFYQDSADRCRRRRAASLTIPSIGVGLADLSKGQPDALDRTVSGVDRQVRGADRKLLLSSGRAGRQAASWERVRLAPGDLTPDGGLARGVWTREIEKPGHEADVWFFVGEGTGLAPEFLQQAAWLMAAEPRVGFCTAWTGSAAGSDVQVFQDPDAWSLARSRGFPLCGATRLAAIRDAGGLEQKGMYFADVLLDLWLRMLKSGWSGAVIPRPLLSDYQPPDYPCWREFRFRSRKDSLRDVLQSHADVFRDNVDEMIDRRVGGQPAALIAPPEPARKGLSSLARVVKMAVDRLFRETG